MEWVETTGRTVDEAKKAALEQLGVAEADADLQVVSEPKIGLFGRLKEEARVRARVQPRYPRSKGERRDRRRRTTGDSEHGPQQNASARPASSAGGPDEGERELKTGASAAAAGNNSESAAGPSGAGTSGGRRRRRPASSAPGATPAREGANFSDVGTASIEEQVRLAEEFLQGLLEELGSSATVSSHELTDGVVELEIDGDNLGTLIGPEGRHLARLAGAHTHCPATPGGILRVPRGGRRQRLQKTPAGRIGQVRSTGRRRSAGEQHEACARADAASRPEGRARRRQRCTWS